MSVLNQSGEEQVECPLCMEPLEVDDLNFFPCTCGYQICRFCWHRIRTDENGLCPACRKAYSENPADFTPLSKEQVAQLKAEKRQRDQQRKAKLSESRKHLANVRVVQKNLVFVVGLPLRLADAEILKRHEYFGKFGKIHKVVINQSTSYAGTQGPSASAYVTYMKSDDALRAIQSVNNITIDGRLIKSSLGTTKYCSHFMKNQPCPKPDCMYLHDFGDPKASFTKEQMHAGKHQEYERKLHEILVTKMALQAAQQQQQQQQQQNLQQQNESKASDKNNESLNVMANTVNANKENWPQLNPEKSDKKSDVSKEGNSKGQKNKSKVKNSECSKKTDKNKTGENLVKNQDEDYIQNTARSKESVNEVEKAEKVENSLPKLPVLDDNSSFFSQNTFQKIVTDISDDDLITDHTDSQTQILNDSLPTINSSEDWQAAFGFSKHNSHLEELAKQRSNIKDTLETFGNSYNNSSTLDMFGSLDNHYNSFDTTSKLQESILEALSSNKHTQFGPLPYSKADRINGVNDSYYGLNGVNGFNGIDQQMSKFLQDFYKNGPKDAFSNTVPNGLNGYNMHNGLTERNNLLYMQQRQLEEQLLNLNLKQTYNQQLLQNGLHNNQYLNGDIMAQNGLLHNQFYQNSVNSLIGKTNSKQPDDLDFDPFHETQKGFAELIQESEQNHKLQGVGRTPGMNGLIHNQSANSHIPPPPPGFMQNTTHMNSFGSKILPYLNMGNSQSHPNPLNNTTQNSWSGNYSQMQQQQHQQQQQQQLKGLGTCNDWKVLDPAIVTSSRHFLLANMQSREHYNNLQPLLSSSQQLQNGPSINNRSSVYDYQNFSNYNPQVQTNSYNNFSQFSTQQNLNWLGNEIGSQITSPPGFRSTNHQTSKQEC